MEDIIQILIFIGAMVIAVIGNNVKAKKNSKTAFSQEVLEDLFPEIEDVQESPITESTLQSVLVRKQNVQDSSISSQKSMSSIIQPEKLKTEKRIYLNSREKVRKAFIYSEIFNRKY